MIPVIDHLNSKFSEELSNDSEQSIDEHILKLKSRSGMKQYIKQKPIKWRFKFSEVLSNDIRQIINEHIVKFKGRSGMK